MISLRITCGPSHSISKIQATDHIPIREWSAAPNRMKVRVRCLITKSLTEHTIRPHLSLVLYHHLPGLVLWCSFFHSHLLHILTLTPPDQTTPSSPQPTDQTNSMHSQSRGPTSNCVRYSLLVTIQRNPQQNTPDHRTQPSHRHHRLPKCVCVYCMNKDSSR